MAPRFGRYVAVDWSARAAPAVGRDSIWIAVRDAGGAVEIHNPPTRAVASLLLGAALRPDAPTLVGIDVGLGYPAGTARRFGLAGSPPWRAMWRWFADQVRDDARNVNNRFDVAAELNRRGGAPAGPFWGCPPSRGGRYLGPRKPAELPLAEFRETEQVLRGAGRRPMSMWQLAGAGSVGSQSITAIPVIERWVTALAGRAHVWPFTTGLAEPPLSPGDVVIAEVWPTAFDPPVDGEGVRDAIQVAHVARMLEAADVEGRLRRWFTPDRVCDPGAVVGEEGWVLGPV